MPAPSLEKLFDFQANLEASLSAYFSANGLPAYTSRSTLEIPDDAVFIAVEVREPVSDHRIPGAKIGAPDRDAPHDWYGIGITVSVRNERTLDAGQTGFASTHDYQVARARVLMLPMSLNGSATRTPATTAISLTYYKLVQVSYSGSQYTQASESLDQTDLQFSAQFWILPDAFPSET